LLRKDFFCNFANPTTVVGYFNNLKLKLKI
jgi:hypothetical protein